MCIELDTMILHAVQAWLIEHNQLYCMTYSMQPCELGVHYLLQPIDTVPASSNTTRIDSLKRVLATVWSI